MAEPIVENRLDIEAVPSWWRTTAAAFRYNNLVGAAISSETLQEALFPTDGTPVSDEEILKTVTEAGLERDIASFGRIKTRGELQAMAAQIAKERQDQQTLDLAETWSGVSANMLAGVLDLPTLIAGPAAAEMAAARGFGRLAQASIGGIASGLTQTAVQEAGLMSLQQTRTPFESLANVGGATLGGAILGPTVAKLFGSATVKKVGDGVRRELQDAISGRAAQQVDDAIEEMIDVAAEHATGASARLAQTPPTKLNASDLDTHLGRGETEYQLKIEAVEEPSAYTSFPEMAARLPDDINERFQVHGIEAGPSRSQNLINLLDGGIDEARPFYSGTPRGSTVDGMLMTRNRAPYLIVSEPGENLRQTGIRNVVLQGPAESLIDSLRAAYPKVNFMTVADAEKFFTTGTRPDVPAPRTAARAASPEARTAGENLTPSEFAFTKRLADDLGIDHADFINKHWDGTVEIDFRHAKGFGIARAVKALNRIGGGNPMLDLTFSAARAMREAVWNFANMKSSLAGDATSPMQVMNMAVRAYGEQGIAKREILDAHREWYRSVAAGQPVEKLKARFGAGSHGLDEFNDIVALAAVHGDDASIHPRAAELTHPAVQRAAKSFRKFNDFMAGELVRSGLLRKGATQENYFPRIYTSQVIGDELAFKDRVGQGYFDKHLADDILDADTTLNNRVAELDKWVDEQLETTLEQIRSQMGAATGRGIEKIDREAIVAKMASANKQTHGLRYGRELERIAARVDREKLAERRRLEEIVKTTKRSKKYSDDDRAEAAEKLLGLDAKYTTRLQELQDATTREFDAVAATKQAELEARNDAWIDREMAKLERVLERQQNRTEDRAVKEIRRVYNRELTKARAAHAAETGPEARASLLRQSVQHADGVFHAVAHHQSGHGSGGIPTGGNVRGSRHEINVHVPTSELIERGWISSDVFEVMHKTARQDGIDAAMARKFRRPMTEQEASMSVRNHPDAYWLDGDHKDTVPDLDMREVKARARAEYDELRAAAKTDVERRALVKAQVKDLEDLDMIISLARGTHHVTKSDAAQLARSANFLVYMGKNALTNIGDAAKLPLVHGLSEVMSYMALRMREKVNDRTFVKDFGRTELKEFAAAANIGLEDVNMTRMLAATDTFDPYSSSVRESRADRWSSFMTQIGSKAYFINHLNDAMKTVAFGIAQHRLGKLALQGKPTRELSLRDQNWLRYIGIDDNALSTLGSELQSRGVGYEPGKPIRFDMRTLSLDMQDRMIAAMHKDNSTTVVSPDALSKPKIAHNPIASLMMQFSSFALESGMATTNLLGQRLRSGEISAPLVGIFGMVGLAWMTQFLTIWADNPFGENDQLRRFWEAHETNPGYTTYTMIDRSGLLGTFGYLSNLTDDAATLGMRSLARAAGGDDLKDAFPFAKKKFGSGNNNDVWKTLGGPLARTATDLGNVSIDVVGSTLGTKYGALPVVQSGQRITQQTVEKGAKYNPLLNHMFTRGISEQYIIPAIGSAFPKR